MDNNTKKPWIKTNTFHYSQFADIKRLVEMKEKRNLKISLCFPTLNEEKTIAKEIIIMRSELMLKHPLVDEIVVIDSGSSDHTCRISEEYGADVYQSGEILSHLPQQYKGKGENLWKALYVTSGDVIVYIDADIKNIHHRFGYGLLAPLLLDESIKYVKAFYDRPIAIDTARIQPTGGGRVTELVVRPLFSLLFPELSQIIQPLSGEYAGSREILENLDFPIGYGIETSMLLDIYEKWGLDIIAQVDLDRRIHRNQDTLSLGRMSFGILQTFLRRLEKQELIELKHPLFDRMIQHGIVEDSYEPKIYEIKEQERPPIITIPEYREKFGK
ncbi:MAG: glucosyl-3-phosphoglycerate synthase [bacterium]|nr:glucosyl-3-phosphoglycerate synthase [bacterium]